MENTVKERLVSYLGINKIKHSDFCESIGVSKGFIAGMRKSIQPDKLKSIAINYPFLNIAWLLTGIGEMKINQPAKSYTKGQPYYNIDFIGGFDLIMNDQTVNPDYNIDYQPYNKEGVFWCNITGRSMEPEIDSGDKLALKEVKDWERYINPDEIYAIVTKNDLRTVKKIKPGNDDRHFLLVPSNPAYSPQPIEKGMIMKVFKVLGCIKSF
jgi:SOS-response transcriptional repressor LexA